VNDRSPLSPPLAPPLPGPAPEPAVDAAKLRGHAVRGGAITLIAQGVKFVLNVASTVLLARLLSPTDYGLFAMVTGFTSLVEILKDGGLSLATVQRDRISDEQISTLFWLNLLLGATLMLVTFALTPLITHFYAEERLTGILFALAGTFLISGLGVQHFALLRRHLRFTLVAAIDAGSMAVGVIVAALLALRGFGYWALVGMAVSSTLASTIAVWIAAPWRPGRSAPLRSVAPMLGFGGNIILTRFVHQFVRSSPNVLIGWYWGPVTVGLYQRAYALLMFAVDQIQGPVAAVMLPPLARIQKDPTLLRHLFLTGYRLIASAIVPVLATCFVFAEEIVALLLGPKWGETALVLRWLAAGGIVVGLLNPQGLLLLALGRADTCMKIGLADALAVVAGYAAGLRFGAVGVGLGFLGAKLALCVPLTYASFRGTPVHWRDALGVVRPPLAASLAAALFGAVLKHLVQGTLDPRTLGVVGPLFTLLLYAAILLFVAGQWSFFRELLQELRPRKRPAAA